MLFRIWKVAIADGKADELEAFAKSRSLPMFREQRGCLGVFFTRSESECATVTLWDGADSIARMESSDSYRATVAAIESSGILGDDHRTEVFSVFGGHVDAELSQLLGAAWNRPG